MPPIIRRYNQGLVTSRDRSSLADGECQQLTGVYYKSGDTEGAYKLDGRSELVDTGEAVKIDGMFYAANDTVTKDRIIFFRGGDLEKVDDDGTDLAAVTDLETNAIASIDGTHLSAAHAADEWFFTTGAQNYILNEDNRARKLGLEAPTEAITAAVLTSTATIVRADTDDDTGTPTPDTNWKDQDSAHDGDFDTYSHLTYNSNDDGTSDVIIYEWTTADTNSDRQLKATWSVESSGSGPKSPFKKIALGNFKVTVKMEYSVDYNSGGGGESWTPFVNLTSFSNVGKHESSVPIAGSADINGELAVRITYTYVRPFANASSKAVTLKVHDLQITTPGNATTYDFTNLKYAVTEYDEERKEESAPGNILDVAGSGADTGVTLTLPDASVNEAQASGRQRVTHWRIYRTPDNGAEDQLGLIAEVPIDQTTFDDNFLLYTPTDQPEQLLEYLEVVDPVSRELLLLPLRSVPPGFHQIRYFDGSLVGIPADFRRRLTYSVPGDYTAWPDNLFLEIPTPEHDKIQDIVEVSGSLVVASESNITRVDELPFIIGGRLRSAKPFIIPGAPGCVGVYALTTCDFQGASHAAWISQNGGVCVTDGHRWNTISKDYDWSVFGSFDKSDWILEYREDIQALVMYFDDPDDDDNGQNNRYLLLHVGSEHLKPGGQAKITGPHHGDVACVTQGLDRNNNTRFFEGHWSDGKIYLNFDSSTGADASDAHPAVSGGSDQNVLTILDGRRYNGWKSYSVLDGKIHHTAFDAQNTTITYTAGRDEGSQGPTGPATPKTITKALNANRGTQIEIGRSGEWHEHQIQHTTAGRGAIYRLELNALGGGPEGQQS